MRKAEKKLALEFIGTLQEAHNNIKELSYREHSEHPEERLALLGDCQQGAIQLGGLIEQSEGEEHPIILLLEEYCEMIYQMYQQTADGQMPQGDMISELTKQMDEVRRIIKDDIPERIEAVFLPYNASMWDSLESVWQAADADEHCDAHVIPIPYYDKNPDGSLGKMYYEGDRYPEYVPIVHYEAYDFQTRRPDMIFIHNPYDQTNNVTSVHPFFYSKNLKQYTDKLVYIPYFVLNEISPDNHMAIKTLEHFFVVPAVIHAHKVIVQSEGMRQVYINAMTAAAGEKTQRIWEEKILGIGSPKMDKVLSVDDEMANLPEDWKKVIQKPDGSRKKIIFYNTSIVAFGNHGEAMLRKIESVLGIFKENAADVALLWRPHPLMESTIKSSHPHLWDTYDKMVRTYREEGWGIYDDTSDLDRAIALCDGYYGDHSSVVQLCQAAGKAVMIQNVNVLGEDSGGKEYKTLIAEDCVQVEDKLYFIARDINIVFSLDLKSGEIALIDSIPEENIFSIQLSKRIMYWKNKLIFLPRSAQDLWVYDLENDIWTSIEIESIDNIYTNKFLTAELLDDNLVMIGSAYPAIIYVNLHTYNVKYIKKPYEELQQFERESLDEGMIRTDITRINNRLYIASCVSNQILVYDMEKEEDQWFSVGDETNRYSGIAWDGTNFWISPRHNGSIVRWDGKSQVLEYDISDCIEGERFLFTGIIYDGRHVVLPGLSEKNTLFFEPDLLKDAKDIKKENAKYLFYRLGQMRNTIAMREDGLLSIMNNKSEERVCFYCNIESKKLFCFIQERFNESPMRMVEKKLIGISLFIELLSLNNSKQNVIVGHPIGRDILRVVKV